jgi:hypothetical protein
MPKAPDSWKADGFAAVREIVTAMQGSGTKPAGESS